MKSTRISGFIGRAANGGPPARGAGQPSQAAQAELVIYDGAIENKVHYVRDVSMREDAGQAWTGHTPGALAALRNAVLNLLRGQGVRAIADALAEYAATPARIFRAICDPLPTAAAGAAANRRPRTPPPAIRPRAA